MTLTIICKTENELFLEVLRQWGDENNYVINENRTRYRVSFSNFTGLGFAATGLDEAVSTHLKIYLQDHNIKCRVDKEHLLSRFIGTIKLGRLLVRITVGIAVLNWFAAITGLIYGIMNDESLSMFFLLLAFFTAWFFYVFVIIHFVPTILVPAEMKSTSN